MGRAIHQSQDWLNSRQCGLLIRFVIGRDLYCSRFPVVWCSRLKLTSHRTFSYLLMFDYKYRGRHPTLVDDTRASKNQCWCWQLSVLRSRRLNKGACQPLPLSRNSSVSGSIRGLMHLFPVAPVVKSDKVCLCLTAHKVESAIVKHAYSLPLTKGISVIPRKLDSS